MLSFKNRIPRTKKPGALQPILPLIPIKLEKEEEDKSSFITFELKSRVGQPADATKYKKHVRKFEEGTPQQLIDLLKDIEEIWTQNAIIGGTDRASTVRSLVKGESLVSFETALAEARMNEQQEEQPIEQAMVATALEALKSSVFPHRALEIQKLWMNRRMFKPAELSTRKTAAAINRLNNALPLFPGGTDEAKFSDVEIVGLLEWSLPPAWRTKFDLDGYVPTLWPKARLIESCEAIERNEIEAPTTTKSHEKQQQQQKNGKSRTSARKYDKKPTGDGKEYHCTEHGTNPTHSTDGCWTLKKRAKYSNDKKSGPKRQFSNKSFRQEINVLAKKSSKKKVLDLYASAVKREQAKLVSKSKKRKAREAIDESDSDSDSSVSVQVINPPKTKRHVKSTTQKRVPRNEPLIEEAEYQKKVHWLKDHGEPETDAHVEQASEENSDSD